MGKLVDADVLMEWVFNWFEKHKYYHPYSKSNEIPITELKDILDNIPSADVPVTNVGDTISRKEALKALEFTWAGKAAFDAIKALPSAEPQRWIPVKTRPMDEEERAYWSDHLGYDIDYEDAVMFDCKMPDDGQEILVSFRKWVNMDKCEIDGGLYGLEGNGDWDGVVAWTPLQKPYKGEDDE